jgi:hypothetical protein
MGVSKPNHSSLGKKHMITRLLTGLDVPTMMAPSPLLNPHNHRITQIKTQSKTHKSKHTSKHTCKHTSQDKLNDTSKHTSKHTTKHTSKYKL